MRGYFSSDMCFLNRELTTCTFVKTWYMLISFFVLTIRDGPKKENRPHQAKTSTKIDLYSFSPAVFR